MKGAMRTTIFLSQYVAKVPHGDTIIPQEKSTLKMATSSSLTPNPNV